MITERTHLEQIDTIGFHTFKPLFDRSLDERPGRLDFPEDTPLGSAKDCRRLRPTLAKFALESSLAAIARIESQSRTTHE